MRMNRKTRLKAVKEKKKYKRITREEIQGHQVMGNCEKILTVDYMQHVID